MRLNWYWGPWGQETERRFASGHPDENLIKDMSPLEREVFRAVLVHLVKVTDKVNGDQ